MPITPAMLVWAYSRGIFPMGDPEDGTIGWYSPDPRAILPLDGFHVTRSLRRQVRKGRLRVTIDRAFEQVIRACAEPRIGDGQTWINPEIIDAYTSLHVAGLAHSVEAWSREPVTDAREEEMEADEIGGRLVGGLYGVSLGGAFFGESMFSQATDASKVCLVHLVEHLRRRGYTLLDTQFSTPHLKQFGVVEISRRAYLEQLVGALRRAVVF